MGTLKVTGYLRGASLSVNQLVHIPGLGDFQMSQIDAPEDPNKLDKTRYFLQKSLITYILNIQLILETKMIVLKIQQDQSGF